MEAHENYVMQHQDIRVEDGIAYGDVIEGVDFAYAAKLTAVNIINLASLAMAPPTPSGLQIGGVVQPSTRLRWDAASGPVAGYRVYWRDTTSPVWQYSRYVGDVTDVILDGIIIDNYLFGVAAVGLDGVESLVAFPNTLIPRR